MHVRSLLVFLALVLAITGCSRPGSSPDAPGMEAPSGVGSTQPYLYDAGDGTILMSWVEAVDSVTHAYRFASYDGTFWTDPLTLASASGLFDNWADVPKLVAIPRGGVVGQYSVSGGDHYFANDLLMRRRMSDGSVSAALRLHDDLTATQHGFGSLALTDEGVVSVWLDGRATKLIEGNYDESEWGEMQLRAAVVNEANEIQQHTLLDERVCDCCPTSAVRTSGGVLIAYRDRTEDETRDIKLARLEDGRWSNPYALHGDGWTIHGCPVNGPVLAASGEYVAAAWFTAADNTPRVQMAFSSDEGRTFGAPIVVDDAGPKGRVDIELMPDRSALVSWIGVQNRMNALMVARVSSENGAGEALTVAFPKSTAFTGIPQMARSGDDMIFAWVDGAHPDSTEINLERRPTASFGIDVKGNG